ncbi:MAG: hypothetical protein IJA52_02815 [Clostridia bacterium]|nr:hypothetical protein [Clostridia bacterium]
MRFNTHERSPKIKINKTLKFLLALCIGFFTALFFFVAIATSIIAQSFAPALTILIPVTLTVAFLVITMIDMNKAYIEVKDNCIRVVDYYFLFKKERIVLLDEIDKAEICIGHSFRVKGYRYSMAGFTYIVFTDKNDKYLFKVINCPETKEYFNKYIKS